MNRQQVKLSGFDSSYVFCFIVHCNCLLFTPLGPDHPWCASGNALTYRCARVYVSTWWNTVRVLCRIIIVTVLVYLVIHPLVGISIFLYFPLHFPSCFNVHFTVAVLADANYIRNKTAQLLWGTLQILCNLCATY